LPPVSTATPYDPNFYAIQSGGSYRSAERIVPHILDLVAPAGILDVGCGVATFLRAFQERGVTDVWGVDGDYVPREKLLIDPARFRGCDLSRPLDMGRRFDMAMSVEVAEHIDEAQSDVFVENICRHADIVLFSAAIPGQGGTHHVNERWPSYWAPKFAARGYRAVDALRPLIWDDASVEYWYRQNALLFVNDAGFARRPGLAAAAAVAPTMIDLVHPAMFDAVKREAAQVTRARAIQSALERLAHDGGSYAFHRNDAGDLTIIRTDVPPAG
jgi:SAM-dependent methyltransferase